MMQTEDKQISLTDPDARSMANPGGNVEVRDQAGALVSR